MKIIQSIPGIFTAIKNYRILEKHKKTILDAKEAGDKETEMKHISLATSSWAEAMCRDFNVKIEVHGRENLPKEGPVVYMANHQGYADIVALFKELNNFQFGFIAKKELCKLPLYGKWMPITNSIAMDRGNPRASLKAISDGANLLKEGYSLAIFPEGTRSQGPDMNEFKPGAMKLATKAKAPIVPISIDDSYTVYESQGTFKSGTIKLLIHPPIETKDMTKAEEKGLNDLVFNTINDGLKELRKSI